MKLLLHMCCGPCAIYPASVIQEEGIYLEGLFFNPNIHPLDEFVRRKENVEIFAEHNNIPVTYSDDYREADWIKFSGTSEERCSMCYNLRLEETARIAKEGGFDAFSTTLLVSPYQKHDFIRELGEKLGQIYGVDFYYNDFRKGFRQGQQKAKEMGLYRQKFCGCIISKNK